MKVHPFDFSSLSCDDWPIEPQSSPEEAAISIEPVESVTPEPESPCISSQSIEAAQQQAELIVREARLKADEIERQAYSQGFSEGERAGKETGEKMVEALLKQYASTLDELKALRSTVLAQAEREVVRLSLEIARKVVKREVVVDEELILTLVRVALSRLSDQSPLTVRVNPRDCQSINNHRHSAAHRDGLHDGIRLVEDPMLSRGGCLIETESGIIDARVEEQFREIENGFFE